MTLWTKTPGSASSKMKPYSPDNEIYKIGFGVGEKRSSPLSVSGSSDPMMPAALSLEAELKALCSPGNGTGAPTAATTPGSKERSGKKWKSHRLRRSCGRGFRAYNRPMVGRPTGRHYNGWVRRRRPCLADSKRQAQYSNQPPYVALPSAIRRANA
jgi:hypothetical protein